jgi:hypothetical protein
MRAFVGVASRRFGLLVLGGALFAEGVAFFVSPFFQKPKNYTRTITVLLLDQGDEIVVGLRRCYSEQYCVRLHDFSFTVVFYRRGHSSVNLQLARRSRSACPPGPTSTYDLPT